MPGLDSAACRAAAATSLASPAGRQQCMPSNACTAAAATCLISPARACAIRGDRPSWLHRPVLLVACAAADKAQRLLWDSVPAAHAAAPCCAMWARAAPVLRRGWLKRMRSSISMLVQEGLRRLSLSCGPAMHRQHCIEVLCVPQLTKQNTAAGMAGD